jgi:hypothetical protein
MRAIYAIKEIAPEKFLSVLELVWKLYWVEGDSSIFKVDGLKPVIEPILGPQTTEQVFTMVCFPLLLLLFSEALPCWIEPVFSTIEHSRLKQLFLFINIIFLFLFVFLCRSQIPKSKQLWLPMWTKRMRPVPSEYRGLFAPIPKVRPKDSGVSTTWGSWPNI